MTTSNQRYLIEVDCSLGQFKSAKLKDKEYTINVTEGIDFGGGESFNVLHIKLRLSNL